MSTLIPFLISLIAVSILTIGLYRIYFHPLSNVPGPRLAALSSLYEVYFDLWLEGQLPFQLISLHEQYGSIVRIGPNEVHISDPTYIPQHFASSATQPRIKYEPHQDSLGVPDSIMSTIDVSTHRSRRAALAPFFSARAITAHEPTIRAALFNINHRLSKAYEKGSVLELRLLFWAMTTDIITSLALPAGMGLLDTENLSPDYRTFATKGQRKLLWFKHFPALWRIMRALPPKWMFKMVPEARVAMEWESRNQVLVRGIITAHEATLHQGKDAPSDKEEEAGFNERTDNDDHDNDAYSEGAYQTAFHTLLSSTLPASEKSFPRLWQECSSLVGAGVETISNTLAVITYHLHVNPYTLNLLRAEFNTTFPPHGSDVEAASSSPVFLPSFSALQSLPYLSAVVNEGLRLAVGVSSRFIRVSPATSVLYGEHSLPPGTVMSMSALVTHRDERAFPKAQCWAPERWLPRSTEINDEDGMRQEQEREQEQINFLRGTADRAHLLSFAKGPRACLGLGLAQAEIALTLALLVGVWNLRLEDTSHGDVEIKHDSVLPMPRADSRGVRIKVLGINRA